MDLTGLEGTLLAIHLSLSVWAAAPEMELDPAEAKRLADAAAEVVRHYPMVAGERTLAWTQLLIVAGNVYVPRGVAYWHRQNHPPAHATPAGNAAAAPPIPVTLAGAGNGAAPRPAVQTPGQLDPGAMLASQIPSAGA